MVLDFKNQNFEIFFFHCVGVAKKESLDITVKTSGKIVVSSIVMLHTFTCCCIYTFVIKNEAGPIVARIFNLFQNGTNEIDLELFRTGLPAELWYLDKKLGFGIFFRVWL